MARYNIDGVSICFYASFICGWRILGDARDYQKNRNVANARAAEPWQPLGAGDRHRDDGAADVDSDVGIVEMTRLISALAFVLCAGSAMAREMPSDLVDRAIGWAFTCGYIYGAADAAVVAGKSKDIYYDEKCLAAQQAAYKNGFHGRDIMLKGKTEKKDRK